MGIVTKHFMRLLSCRLEIPPVVLVPIVERIDRDQMGPSHILLGAMIGKIYSHKSLAEGGV